LELTIDTECWHAMYLSRLVRILSTIIFQETNEKIITIGYPLATDIEKIIKIAEGTFGYSTPIDFLENNNDHYVPDVAIQNNILPTPITQKDFEDDVRTYFKK